MKLFEVRHVMTNITERLFQITCNLLIALGAALTVECNHPTQKS